jgi:hypothetical protein
MKSYFSLSHKVAAIKADIQANFIGVTMLNGLRNKYDLIIMAMESTGTKTSKCI